MTARKLPHRQARWSLELADYNLILKHRPGSLNKKADLLLQQKDHKEGVKDDNIGVMVLKKGIFRAIVVDLGGSGEELMEKIDPEVKEDRGQGQREG